MNSSEATKEQTPVKEEIEPSSDESSSYSRQEETPIQSEEEDEEDDFDKELARWKKLIYVYSSVKGRTKGYLPSIHSQMGSSLEYLSGIAGGVIHVARNSIIRKINLAEAPSDAALFEILKNAHWTTKKVDWWDVDLGYNLNLMPDTEYMIAMIFFLWPDHDLRRVQYQHLDYFPV